MHFRVIVGVRNWGLGGFVLFCCLGLSYFLVSFFCDGCSLLV